MITFRGHPSGSLKVNKDDYKTDYKVDYGRATGVKGRSARRSRLLWPGFLGCTKRKQAARRNVIHATANTREGGGERPPERSSPRRRAAAYCKILLQPNSALVRISPASGCQLPGGDSRSAS